eukprot:scaffold2413_cov171-Amphora_coffeaeformis.AAC.11
MAHERDGTSKERSKARTGGFFENFPNGFGCTCLTEVGTLLLFNHTNRIDKGRTEDGGSRCGGKARILTFAEKEGKAETVVINKVKVGGKK